MMISLQVYVVEELRERGGEGGRNHGVLISSWTYKSKAVLDKELD